MKLFIAQNMHGLSESEVIEERNRHIKAIREYFHEETIEVVDNYHHENVPECAGRLWHLGASIQQLDECDAIYFITSDVISNGVRVEQYIASLYGLRVLNNEMRPR